MQFFRSNHGDAYDPINGSGWRLFSFRPTTGFWQGRVHLSPDANAEGYYIAHKLARQSDLDGRRLRLEESRLRQGQEFGLFQTTTVLHGVKPLEDIIGALPKDLNPEHVLKLKIPKASRQYFTWKYNDLPAAIRPYWVREFALLGLRDQMVWLKNGYLHTSLSPLTHSNVFDETWFWNIDPVGEIQDLRESLKHTNMRRTGLEDLEHVRKIDGSLNLEFAIGQALVEWIIPTTYAGFMNSVPVEESFRQPICLREILSDGIALFLQTVEAESLTPEMKTALSDYLESFAVEWHRNRLEAPISGGPTGREAALKHLIDLTHLFIERIEHGVLYRKLKKEWLSASLSYRASELRVNSKGIILKRSWIDRKIQILSASGKTSRDMVLKAPPRAYAIGEDDRLYVIVDNKFLEFDKFFRPVGEISGYFVPLIHTASGQKVILLTGSGEIQVYDRGLKPAWRHTPVGAKEGALPILASAENNELLYSLKQNMAPQMITCVDIESGEKKWEFESEKPFDVMRVNMEGQVLVGGERHLSLYDREGSLLSQSDAPEFVTNITFDSQGSTVMATDKHCQRAFIFDKDLHCLTSIVSYGNEQRVLIYTGDMELYGEIRGIQNPYTLLEHPNFELVIVPKTKNMGIIKYNGQA